MKTPVEVVEAALAKWGDEKALAAFAEVKAMLDGRFSEATRNVNAELLERLRRAEADNAALLAEMKEAHDNYESISGDVFSRAHPGAALLEELEGLRRQVAFKDGKIERLEEEVREHFAARQNALKVVGALRAELKSARDAALEEAARLFAYAMAVPLDSDTVQFRILALKKTGHGA